MSTPFEKAKETIAEMKAHSAALAARVEKLNPIHEDLIIIERLNIALWKSFLETDSASDAVRMRTSYYGRIVRISPRDTMDEIKEGKKRDLKVGDIVSFNPDSAYSLNIHKFEEVWILSVENILAVDNGVDHWGLVETHLQDKFAAVEKSKANIIPVVRDTRLVDPNEPTKFLPPIIRVAGDAKDMQRKMRDRYEEQKANKADEKRGR